LLGQHYLGLPAGKAKVGELYKSKIKQLRYCNSDTTTEVFGVDNLEYPLNSSIRLEFLGIEDTLKKYRESKYEAYMINPMPRFFNNYFQVNNTKDEHVFYRSIEFDFMVTDSNLTSSNTTWLVMITYNEALVTILMKTIDIDIRPKVASSYHYTRMQYYNNTAMAMNLIVYPEVHSNTDMKNSFLFIEAEDSYVKLRYGSSRNMQANTILTELNNRRIVIKFHLLLRVTEIYTFFIIKDIKNNLNTPRKPNVRITFIYNSYDGGNLTRQISSSSIVTPLSTTDRIPGFYLSDIATGLCLEHNQQNFVFGHRCSKFKFYNYVLQDEFGRCMNLGEDKNVVSGSCSKRSSSKTKHGMKLRGSYNLNAYKIFSGGNAILGNKLYVVSFDIGITQDFQATYTKFGWTIPKKGSES